MRLGNKKLSSNESKAILKELSQKTSHKDFVEPEILRSLKSVSKSRNLMKVTVNKRSSK